MLVLIAKAHVVRMPTALQAAAWARAPAIRIVGGLVVILPATVIPLASARAWLHRPKNVSEWIAKMAPSVSFKVPPFATRKTTFATPRARATAMIAIAHRT
jgi:hypothetical protein